METLMMGSRFDPNSIELVMHYLHNKVEKGETSFITDMDIYENEPWLLEHVTPNPLFMEREWFYYVRRTQVANKKLKRTVSARNGESEGGKWRNIHPTKPKKEILDSTKAVIGYKQSFVYCKKEKGKGKKTDWWMKEFSLCDDQCQDWVLCRIRHKPQDSKLHNVQYEQKEEASLSDIAGELGKLQDEDADVTRQQQETPIPQDSEFNAKQSNNNIKWLGGITDAASDSQSQRLTRISRSRHRWR